MHFLNEIKKDYPHTLKISLEQESSGGLLIPVLTVTNMNQTEKSTCLCTARLHPGETQGSWMIEGFIKSLLSPKGHELR